MVFPVKLTLAMPCALTKAETLIPPDNALTDSADLQKLQEAERRQRGLAVQAYLVSPPLLVPAHQALKLRQGQTDRAPGL